MWYEFGDNISNNIILQLTFHQSLLNRICPYCQRLYYLKSSISKSLNVNFFCPCKNHSMHEDITASLFPSPKRREWRRGQLSFCITIHARHARISGFLSAATTSSSSRKCAQHWILCPQKFFNPRRKKKAHNQHTDPIVRIKCAFSGRAGCPVNCAQARSRGSPKRRKRCLKDQTQSSEMTIIPSCGDESNCH